MGQSRQSYKKKLQSFSHTCFKISESCMKIMIGQNPPDLLSENLVWEARSWDLTKCIIK